MSVRHSLAGLTAWVLLCGMGCTKTGNNDRARLMKDVDTTLTHPVVVEDIEKHIGKRVAWYGLYIGSDEAKQIDYYTYMPTAQNSPADFEKPFMFNRLNVTDMRTEKVGDNHRQLIIGTISAGGEFKYGDGGAVTKQMTAPVLKDVCILEAEE